MHRRARAAEPAAARPVAPLSFKSAFAARPPLWLAIRTTDPKPVQDALGLNQPTPCSWTEGMTVNWRFFIGPPVNGWIIVTGSGLPNPSCDVDECFRFLAGTSRQLGQVQLFLADRVLHYHAGHARKMAWSPALTRGPAKPFGIRA